MTQQERIKICSTCTNRRFSTAEGLLCGISGEKPAYINACNNYNADPLAQERQRQKEEELKNSHDISDFMAFYVYLSIPLGIIFTILNFFITPRNMDYYAGSVCLLLYEILFYAFYFYFGAYTVYAFIKKKSDAVFIAKYNLIILFISNLLILLTGTTGMTMLDSPFRIIMSLVWSVVFFLYLIFSEDVKDRFPKEKRSLTKHNKILIILSIVLPVMLYIGGIVEIITKSNGYSSMSSDMKKIEQLSNQTRVQLPKAVGEEMYWVDLIADNGVVEYRYEYKEDVYASMQEILSEDFLDLIKKSQAEYIKISLVNILSTEADELLNIVRKAGDYDLSFSYYSPDEEHMFSVIITGEELSRIYENKSYHTSTIALESVLDSYNNMMPIEYFEGCLLNKCTLSDDGRTLNYDLQLVGMTMGDLTGLTQQYLKIYMLGVIPYLSDAPYQLAKMNNLNLSYDFTADCSDWWKTEVLIKSSEYVTE